MTIYNNINTVVLYKPLPAKLNLYVTMTTYNTYTLYSCINIFSINTSTLSNTCTINYKHRFMVYNMCELTAIKDFLLRSALSLHKKLSFD